MSGGSGNWVLENVTIKNNSSSPASYGGGICLYYSSISINNSIIYINSGSRGVAFVYRSPSNATINNSVIVGNSATGDGGGIYARAGSEINMTNFYCF